MNLVHKVVGHGRIVRRFLRLKSHLDVVHVLCDLSPELRLSNPSQLEEQRRSVLARQIARLGH